MTPAIIVMSLCALLPLIIIINYSVQDSFAGDHFYWVGLRWFEEISRSPEFWEAVLRTLIFSVIVIPLQFIIGIFVARKLL